MLPIKPAFTLVELIITMAILAILAVFGFVYMAGNIKDSRDVARIADLDNVEKTLEIYTIQNGDYPLPDNYTTITHGDSSVWYQGSLGDDVFRALKKLSNKPVDPLDNTEYSYSVLNNTKEYEISTVFEGDLISHIPGINHVHAENNKAYLIGNYNKQIVSIETGGRKTILALPSITSSDISTPELESIIDNNNMVIHGEENLPAVYNNGDYDQSGNNTFSTDSYVVFDGATGELQSPIQQRIFIEKLQSVYQQNPQLANDTLYQEIMSINPLNRSEIKQYIQKLEQKQTGGI